MPEYVKKMLNDLKKNGAEEETKVIASALDAVIDILIENRKETILYRCEREKKELEFRGEVRNHLLDTEAHTPKGILLRKDVVTYFIIGVGIITGIVYYIPELIKWLMAL